MTAKITLHQLPGSPNNIKVRIALNHKGIAWTSAPFALEGPFPGDRSALVELSRQPFTPVLQHGETTLFDSGAILRYLEANFPQTPPLFSSDYDTQRSIERWELFARTDIEPAVGMVFGQVFAPSPDLDLCRQASRLVNENTGCMEEALATTPYLVSDSLTAADAVLAPFVNLAMVEPTPDEGPIYAFFREHFHLGEGRDATRSWVKRVMALASTPAMA